MKRLTELETQEYFDQGKAFTRQIRPAKEFFYEKVDDTTLVEPECHVSTKIRIEQFMDAGVRLKEFRKEQFHFQHDEKINEDFYDPTLNPDFSEMDAVDLARNVQENMRASKIAKEKKDEKINNNSNDQSSAADTNTDKNNPDSRILDEQTNKVDAKS